MFESIQKVWQEHSLTLLCEEHWQKNHFHIKNKNRTQSSVVSRSFTAASENTSLVLLTTELQESSTFTEIVTSAGHVTGT